MNAMGRWLVLSIVVLSSCISAPQTASPAPSPVAQTAQPSPSLAATPTPTRRLLFTPTPLPTSRPGTGLVTHENPILGYRITLPEARRRSGASVIAGSSSEFLGGDMYTARSEAEDREACLSDAGTQPRLEGEPDLVVSASRNTAGESAEAWATTPRSPGAQPMSTHMLVERTTIDGREAVRLVRDQVQNHETTAYVIRANERMYTLRIESDSIPSRAPGFLDGVATSFHVIQPQPFPTATPSPSVAPAGERARELGQRISRAFGDRDVDTIAELITPRCWIGTLPIVPPGIGVGGSSRAVVPLLEALRNGFARGVAVAADPAVQVQVDGTGTGRMESFYVASIWTSASGTLRVNLFFSEIESRMYWTGVRFDPNPAAPCDLRRILHGDQSGSSC